MYLFVCSRPGGRSRNGTLVYYERPGDIQLKEMKARGVSVEAMLRHWLFITEWQFRVLLNNDESAKTVAILDVEHIDSSFLTGDPYQYFKQTVTAANAHYVERSQCVLVVNASPIMKMIWKIAKQFVHPNSQKKVRILSKADTLSGLQEFIDIDQIPVYYGGNLRYEAPSSCIVDINDNDTADDPQIPNHVSEKDVCRYYSPDTIQLNQYVEQINKQTQKQNVTHESHSHMNDSTSIGNTSIVTAVH